MVCLFFKIDKTRKLWYFGFANYVQEKGKIHMGISWDEAPAILTPKEAAILLGLSVDTVRRRCAKKELPAIQIGKHWRIDKQKLMELTK